MKLIATKPFRNVPSLRLIEDGKSTLEGSVHDLHVHKGAVFSIGDDKLKLNTPGDLQKLNKSDATAANTVSLLIHAGCVGDATDEKTVADVKKSAEEDVRKAEAAKKADQLAQNASAFGELLKAVRSLKPA